MIYRAVYVSRSIAPITSSLVDDILRGARRHNSTMGVTGLLLVTSNIFIQAIEGSRAAVTLTMTRILADRRHTDVEIIEILPVLKRHFFAWDMYQCELSDDDPILRKFALGTRFDPYHLDPASMTELLIEAAQR